MSKRAVKRSLKDPSPSVTITFTEDNVSKVVETLDENDILSKDMEPIAMTETHVGLLVSGKWQNTYYPAIVTAIQMPLVHTPSVAKVAKKPKSVKTPTLIAKKVTVAKKTKKSGAESKKKAGEIGLTSNDDLKQKKKELLQAEKARKAAEAASMQAIASQMFRDNACVLDIVRNLRIAFKEMIDKLDWMENATKVTAKEKVDALDPRLGYPDIVYNDTALNEKYHDVTISANSPLHTIGSIGMAAVVRQLKKLRKPYDNSEWAIGAAIVNAYYDKKANQITFPAAILQPPFYTKDQPAYLNYGGIGYVIGHEITHGFDDQGRLYNATGHLKAWWTDNDITKFKQKAQCIIDQYSNFTVEGTGGMMLNGVTTQGENIADNGGIKESFKAYRNWVAARGQEEQRLPGLSYTSNQLYFLNAAQIWCAEYTTQSKIKNILRSSHPLNPFRVYGPLQNFDEFSKAWNCSMGSFMNKQNKCAVW